MLEELVELLREHHATKTLVVTLDSGSFFAFAFSSLVGNYFYAESNILFIKNNKTLLFVFRITCIVAIFLGAQADFSLVWNLADVTMGFMAIVNIAAILLLGNIAIHALEDYEKQKKQGKDPVFDPERLGIANADCWKAIVKDYKEDASMDDK